MRDYNDKTNDKRETIEFELFLAFYLYLVDKKKGEIIAYIQVNTRWQKLHRLFSI